MLWMTPEITAAMQQRFSGNSELDVLEALDIDVRWLLPDYIGPELKETPDAAVGLFWDRLQEDP